MVVDALPRVSSLPNTPKSHISAFNHGSTVLRVGLLAAGPKSCANGDEKWLKSGMVRWGNKKGGM